MLKVLKLATAFAINLTLTLTEAEHTFAEKHYDFSSFIHKEGLVTLKMNMITDSSF